MKSGKQMATMGCERHSLVPNSGNNNSHNASGNGSTPSSRRASVPFLDEESLQAKTLAVAHPNVFTLVSKDEENAKSGGANVNAALHSPSHHLENGQIQAMLQQQQAVAMAAAQLEQAYHQTCYLLQQCSPNALLTVLMSLLNDYPTTLLQPIRARVEQVLAHQMSPATAGRMVSSGRKASEFVPNSSAAPWTPSHMRGSAVATPTANGTTPSHRRGRAHKGKEEEQEICSIHNNVRAMKHLQLNATTGLYECIHGFHCLVDGPSDLTVKRNNPIPAMQLSTSVSVGARPTVTGPPAEGRPYIPAVFTPPSESRFSASDVEALRMLDGSLQNRRASQSSPSPQPTQQPPHVQPPSPQKQFQQQPQPQQHSMVPSQNSPPYAPSSSMMQDTGLGLREPNHFYPEATNRGLHSGFTVVGADRSNQHSSPVEPQLNMDIPSLEYLLQSVREIDDE